MRRKCSWNQSSCVTRYGCGGAARRYSPYSSRLQPEPKTWLNTPDRDTSLVACIYSPPMRGVVCSPLVRTHLLDFPSRSLMLLRCPTIERMNTPVATPFSRPVIV